MAHKIFICIAVVFAVIFLFLAFGLPATTNKKIFDFTYSFERAQIHMPDGSVVEGFVDSWNDYKDSDCVQIEIDGKIYLTHYSNVVLISD